MDHEFVSEMQHFRADSPDSMELEPSINDKHDHAMVCFCCQAILFSRRCLWHHAKRCVRSTSSRQCFDCDPPCSIRVEQIASRVQNSNCSTLQWIDCNSCDTQIPWLHLDVVSRQREHAVLWLRFVGRLATKQKLREKLQVLGRRNNPLVATLELVVEVLTLYY